MSYGLAVMRFGKYRFVPTLWPSLFFVLLMPLFISLGVWQLNRADEKTRILADLEIKNASISKNISLIDVDIDSNTRIHLSGQVLSTQQFLIDNKIHKTIAGYELIAPVKLNDDGRIVLLSRGWVGQGRTRSELPDVELEMSMLNRVTGLFTRPSKGYTIGNAFDAENKDWPKVIQYLDYQQISSVLGASVIEGVVQLDMPIGKEYPKFWKPVAFRPEKHLGYAAQWFAIALVSLVLFIVLNTKIEESI